MKRSMKVPCAIWVIACFVPWPTMAQGGPPASKAPAKEPAKEVVVVNPVTEPVPVSGRMIVAGPVDVSVTGTVPVTVDGVVTVKKADDQLGRPTQAVIRCEPSGSYRYSCENYAVPEGFRLVIEQVAVDYVPNDPTTQVAAVSIQTIAGGVSAQHGIEPPAARTFRDSYSVQRGSQLTRIYADAGSLIYFYVLISKSATPLNEQMMVLTLSGQLIEP